MIGQRIIICAGSLSFTLLLLFLVRQIIQNSGSDEGSATLLSKLWESDSSPNHNPYFNVFKQGELVIPKRRWSSREVRERVWQTMKDVQAMENHVQQQKELNKRLKVEVARLEAGFAKEKEVVEELVNKGLGDVDNRFDMVQAAISANISAAKSTLDEVAQQARGKQAEQDRQIIELENRHKDLADQTREEYQEINTAILNARRKLAASKLKMVKDREDVKGMILRKMEGDLSSLSREMLARFNSERRRVKNFIAEGMREVQANVTVYNQVAGARVAALSEAVARLRRLEKTAAGRQSNVVKQLVGEHAELRDKAAGAVKELKARLDAQEKGLDEAEKDLRAEEDLRNKFLSAHPEVAAAAAAAATEEAAAEAAAAERVQRGKQELAIGGHALKPTFAAAAHHVAK